MAFQMNVSGIFQKDLLCIKHIYLNTAFGLVIFQYLGRKQKSYLCQNPAKTRNFPQMIWENDLRTIQKHIEERNLLNASQFGFWADHSTTLQCMRLVDHVTLNFNENILTAAVFLDKAFNKTWHPDLLYKLSEFEFPKSFVKLNASFLTNRECSPGRRRIFYEKNSCRGAWSFHPCPRMVQSIYNPRCPRGIWNASCSVRGRYLYLHDRGRSCSLQTATWPKYSEVAVWT
jgi:hypothetical protein